MHVVRCGHCGTRVPVNAWREPLSYAEREAEGGQQKLVIIGGDGLLHECIIDETKAYRGHPAVPATRPRATPHEVRARRFHARRKSNGTEGFGT